MDEESQAVDNAKAKFNSKNKKSQLLFLINILSALIIFSVGLYQIITFYTFLKALSDLRFFRVFAPFFMIVFALILLFLEVGYKNKEIYQQFHFLKMYLGRIFFHLFLSGIVAGTYFEAEAVRYICGGVLLLPAIYYTIEFFRGKREFQIVEMINTEDNNNSNNTTQQTEQSFQSNNQHIN